jgi:hypothetical protein
MLAATETVVLRRDDGRPIELRVCAGHAKALKARRRPVVVAGRCRRDDPAGGRGS